MTNTREQTQEEQRQQFQHEAQNSANEKVQTQSETDRRHYEPIQNALPSEGDHLRLETRDRRHPELSAQQQRLMASH